MNFKVGDYVYWRDEIVEPYYIGDYYSGLNLRPEGYKVYAVEKENDKLYIKIDDNNGDKSWENAKRFILVTDIKTSHLPDYL
jgi:hypothetical protein